MKIVSLREDKNIEKRISITPEIAKKYINLGFSVSLPESYGDHLGFTDQNYKNSGVDISNDEKEIINSADIVVQLNLPSDEKLLYLKENQNLIGVLNPYLNKEKIGNLVKKKINNFSLELLPRIQGPNPWIFYLHKQI